MTEVVSVKFKTGCKNYYFSPEGIDISTGDWLGVETAKGMEMAQCSYGNHLVEDTSVVQPLRPVVRIATEDDFRVASINKKREAEAFDICKEKIQSITITGGEALLHPDFFFLIKYSKFSKKITMSSFCASKLIILFSPVKAAHAKETEDSVPAKAKLLKIITNPNIRHTKYFFITQKIKLKHKSILLILYYFSICLVWFKIDKLCKN